MRTKTLLLTAVLGVATAATSMADVFSLNVVGYINRDIPVGFSMLANQLQGTNAKVSAVITAPPNNTAVFLFDAVSGSYKSMTYVDGGWEGDDVDLTIPPGEGAFIFTPTHFTNTFVGEVITGPNTNVVRSGFQIKSSKVPQAGALDSLLGYVPGNNDAVFLFNPVTQSYISYTYVDGAWEGDVAGSPAPGVGDSFFLYNSGVQKNWTRTFTP